MAPTERDARPAASGPGAGHEAVAKEALREEMRRARRAIPAQERKERSSRVTHLLSSLPELRSARAVLAFSSFGSEVETGELLSFLEESGVAVFLPFLNGGEMFVAEHPRGARLVETAYGPREPSSPRAGDPARIGAAVVPGLAFDRRGGRLGYGGGHYDRFLRQLPAAASLIGVAFSEQVVVEVPLGETDVLLDLVVSDEEVIRCRKEQGAAGPGVPP